jgi:hypothetical protein
MADARDRRIAKEALDYAAWQCQECGIAKEEALRIVSEQYDDTDALKKGGE